MMPRQTPRDTSAPRGRQGMRDTGSDTLAPASAQTPRGQVLLPAAAAQVREPFLLRVLIALAARAADDGWCRLNMRQLAAFIGHDSTHGARVTGLADVREVWTALYQLDEMGLVEGRRNPAYANELDPLAVVSWYQDVPARFWRVAYERTGAGEDAAGGEGAPE